jgi:hypothetical protein
VLLPGTDDERLGEPVRSLDVTGQMPVGSAGAASHPPKLCGRAEERLGVSRRERVADGNCADHSRR